MGAAKPPTLAPRDLAARDVRWPPAVATAFLVDTSALFVGRPGFGLLLVLAFSIGLAASLTVVGITAIHASKLLSRRALRSRRLARVVGVVPLIGAVVCWPAERC